MTRWAILIILAAGLGGCMQTRVVTQTQIEIPTIPAYLQRCADRPTPPSQGRTQRDVARYIVQLSHRGDDCAEKLRATVALTQQIQTRVEVFNAEQRSR